MADQLHDDEVVMDLSNDQGAGKNSEAPSACPAEPRARWRVRDHSCRATNRALAALPSASVGIRVRPWVSGLRQSIASV